MRAETRRTWIAIGVAGVIGVVIGRAIYAIANVPNMAGMLGTLMLVVFIGILGLLVVVGLGIATFGDRKQGSSLLLFTVSMAAGAYLAGLYGEGIQIVSEREATVEVTLAAPIGEAFSGDGTCFTVANGERIARIASEGLVEVGEDRMSISVSLDTDGGPLPQHRVTLVPEDPTERLAGYHSGIVTDVDVAADGDWTSGLATFTSLQADPQREPLGGPGGPDTIDGSVSWTCRE